MIGFPSGCWKIDNGTYNASSFAASDVFAMGGIPVLSHEPYGSIGLANMADFLDPTPYGDMSLMNRRTAATMDVTTGWLYNMQNTGLTSFCWDGSGFVA